MWSDGGRPGSDVRSPLPLRALDEPEGHRRQARPARAMPDTVTVNSCSGGGVAIVHSSDAGRRKGGGGGRRVERDRVDMSHTARQPQREDQDDEPGAARSHIASPMALTASGFSSDDTSPAGFPR